MGVVLDAVRWNPEQLTQRSSLGVFGTRESFCDFYFIYDIDYFLNFKVISKGQKQVPTKKIYKNEREVSYLTSFYIISNFLKKCGVVSRMLAFL